MNSLFFLLALLFAITQAAPVTTSASYVPPTPLDHVSEPGRPAPPRRTAGIHPGAGVSTNDPSRPPHAVTLSRTESDSTLNGQEASVASGNTASAAAENTGESTINQLPEREKEIAQRVFGFRPTTLDERAAQKAKNDAEKAEEESSTMIDAEIGHDDETVIAGNTGAETGDDVTVNPGSTAADNQLPESKKLLAQEGDTIQPP
jgi:hypothetical protein